MTDPAPGAGNETAHEQEDVVADPAAANAPAEDVQKLEVHETKSPKRDVDGTEDTTEGETEDDEENETEDDEEEEDEDDEEEDDDDEEPRLKYARLTQHLSTVYRNADATSAFLVAGDKMVWVLTVHLLSNEHVTEYYHRS